MKSPVSLNRIPDHYAEIRPLLATHAKVELVGIDGVSNLAELAGLAGEDLLANYWRLLAKSQRKQRWTGAAITGVTVEAGQAHVVCAVGQEVFGVLATRALVNGKCA